jgi:hypothetical protein
MEAVVVMMVMPVALHQLHEEPQYYYKAAEVDKDEKEVLRQ